MMVRTTVGRAMRMSLVGAIFAAGFVCGGSAIIDTLKTIKSALGG